MSMETRGIISLGNWVVAMKDKNTVHDRTGQSGSVGSIRLGSKIGMTYPGQTSYYSHFHWNELNDRLREWTMGISFF